MRFRIQFIYIYINRLCILNVVNVYNLILIASVEPVQAVVSIRRTSGYVAIGFTRSKELLNRFDTGSFIIVFEFHLI